MESIINLESEHLLISIQKQGAEICSVKDKKTGFEYMWDANPKIWSRHAPVLFPIVGKLNANKVKINNKTYEMGQHGFARDMEFEPIEVYQDTLRFMIESNDQTLKIYPYQFRFFITYALEKNQLSVTYTTLNMGQSELFFSVGAHPGFMLPSSNLKEYVIQFEKDEILERHLLKEGLLSGETENIGNGKVLPLNKELFDKDAIVLKVLKSSWLSLVQTESNFAIKLNFEGFPYMGIWTKPGQEAFICLEPWQGIADNLGFEGDISEKEGIHKLAPNSELSFSYSLEFFS